MRGAALVGALFLAVLLAGVALGSRAPVLSGRGIGGVRFGLPEARAVDELTALFGAPSRRFVNKGCGPRFGEVAWGHLYVEFRLGRLSGFRYIEDGWPPTRSGGKIVRSDVPELSTSHGVTLGGTLARLRDAYLHLTFVGTDRWQSPDGLIFYDDAAHDPEPATSRIIEIKTGTCGDF